MKDKNKKEIEKLKRPNGVSDEQWEKANELYEAAKRVGDPHPELTVAQAALESAWFKKTSGKNNYFGQKATKSQKGSDVATHEYNQGKKEAETWRFRDYDTLDEAMKDRMRLWAKKYENAKTPYEAIDKIWQYDEKTKSGKGYATDPKYGGKINTILNMLGVSKEDKEKEKLLQKNKDKITKIYPDFNNLTGEEQDDIAINYTKDPFSLKNSSLAQNRNQYRETPQEQSKSTISDNTKKIPQQLLEEEMQSLSTPGKMQTDFLQNYLTENQLYNGGSLNNIQNNSEQLLTEFNEGGSHEQNPLGGIPQGQDEQGVPNKVEEGEVKINLGQDNYILPIRNGEMVTKEILQQFNLPTKYAGKPLADIAKKLTAQYKESNNFIDKETAKEELEKLKAINEVFLAEKKRQEQMNPDNGLNIDMLEEDSNEFFLGGGMDNEDIGGLAGIAGAGLTALTANKPSAAGGAASGALSGVGTGAALGPIGMIAGGAIGALTGGIFGNKAKKAQEELADKKFNAISNQYRQYENGGNMKTKKNNFYPNGGWITKAFDSINSFTDGLNIDLGANLTTPGVTREQAERRPIQSSINAGLTKYTPGYTPPKADLSGSASSSNEDKKKSSIFGNIKDTAIGAMRYASPLNNLMQLSQMEKPTFEPSNKIDKRYEPSLFDEQSITNLVRESAGNTRRALHESSGGDAGALSSNLIASQLAETKGLSSAMMQGQDINRQEKAREQEFNLGVDQLNTQIDMADKEGFRKDKGAYSSNKSRLQSALATDLSNISLEEMRKKYPEMMGLSYSWKGDFLVGTDKDGNIISRIHGDNVPKKED